MITLRSDVKKSIIDSAEEKREIERENWLYDQLDELEEYSDDEYDVPSWDENIS